MATQKIAFVTNDGKKISQHFGRAQYYQVLTIEDGKIIAEEQRAKLGHQQFGDRQHNHGPHGDGHGAGRESGEGHGMHSRDKHMSMLEAIADCEVLVARGMGRGAYMHLEEAKIKPFVTDITDIHAAAEAYIGGKLEDHTEKLH